MSDIDKENKPDNRPDDEKNRTGKKQPTPEEILNELKKKSEKLQNLKKQFGMDDGKRGPDGKRRDRKPDNNQWKASTKTLLVWAAIVTLALIIMNFMEEGGSVKEFSSINEFNKYLEVIKKIEITNVGTSADISGEFKEPVNFSVNGSSKKFSKFILTYPFVEIEKASEWEEKGIEVKFTKEGIGFSSFLISMIPWILIIALWIYLLRRMQGGNQNGGKGIFNFGKSRARLITEANNPIKFTDVAGAKEAKEELQEVISFLKSPGRYIEIGAKIPKGILLLGSPGTGKTLLAKAVAGEAGVPFFSMSGADFVEMFVGVGASRVRDLFEQARRQTPCIIFIDELDAVGRHRGTGIGGGNDEREQTLNQLLVEMDGFETRETIILIAATNRPDVLDPALLRPGRFDRQIVVDRPDVKARKEILEVHAKKIKVNKNGIDFEVVAKSTPGMSGADLANIVNEAALLAARQGRKLVEMIDIEEAKDKVMMGVERKSAVINEREKELTAYHEAGHVLVAKFTEDSDPVHKVTIIPRGRAMGVTHYIPIEDRHSYSKKYIMSKLLHLLGGRVAEELVFNDVTTGASNDIERATDLARKMVCEWGMSDEVGPIHYGVKNEDPFLGKQLTRTSSVSEKIGNTIDLAIQKIIFDALEQTRKILNDNIDLLHKLSKELLEKETLTGEEINNILSPKVDEAIEIETESESVMA